MIIPIQLTPTLAPDDIEELSLKDLKLTEADLEEFVRKNVEYLFPEGETLLIVGQQPRNKAGGKADLVALDGDGNVVLVELKRDVDDITARREPFEFQAIRYAANYAKILTTQELAQKLFGPYIERHQVEFELGDRTPTELAVKLINEFLQVNKAEQVFNKRQRIILIASSYDPQTLSACAWLSLNGIDIKCLSFLPLRYGPQYFFQIEQIIPPPKLDQYFVEIAEHRSNADRVTNTEQASSRESLPKMSKLFEWGLVTSGDEIFIRDHETQPAQMKNAKSVLYEGRTMGYNDWGKKVTGWSGINVYEWTVHKRSNQNLDSLRRAKMAELEAQETESGTTALVTQLPASSSLHPAGDEIMPSP